MRTMRWVVATLIAIAAMGFVAHATAHAAHPAHTAQTSKLTLHRAVASAKDLT